MRLRRRRFADVVRRQLDLFEREHADVLRACEAALAAYEAAGRDDAERRYGDYVDAVEEGTELLADTRDRYRATLGEDLAERYEDEFNRAVARRLPAFGLEIEQR